jgi:hypothetical protein
MRKENFHIKKIKKNKTKKSIIVNLLNRDADYKTDSTMYEKIMMVKITKKQHKNSK